MPPITKTTSLNLTCSSIINQTAKNHQLFLDPTPTELKLPPTAEGNEHQAWFIENRGIFLKATRPDHLGIQVVYRNVEEPQAHIIGYLECWLCHNQLFGDNAIKNIFPLQYQPHRVLNNRKETPALVFYFLF